MFDFNGKVALITGGTRGIGFSIAVELLRNNVKGVSLIGINAENGKAAADKLAQEFSKNCVIYIQADVSIRSQIEDAFEKTVKFFDRIDIVVNNAGIIHELNWEDCVVTNLQGCITGSLLALEKYFPKTANDSEKLILNVSSTMGLSFFEYTSVYNSTKHGIIWFSKCLGDQIKTRGMNVKVLVICPGVTLTDMLVHSDRMHKEFYELSHKYVEKWKTQTLEELMVHTMPIINNAKSGSVWVIDNNISSEVELPSLMEM